MKKAFFGGLLDLLFTPRCLRCGSSHRRSGSSELCETCRREDPGWPVPLCPGCGKAPSAGPLDFCPNCRGGYFRDGLLASAPFEGVRRDLIHALKYRADFQAGRFLAGSMEAMMEEDFFSQDALVVPVPLHRRRLRERGFNQACVLARLIARERRLSFAPRMLRRRRDTRPLTGLDRSERAGEVKGSIALRRDSRLEGKDVLLVDDVVTTGMTVEECCRVLKEGGAARVCVVAAARA